MANLDFTLLSKHMDSLRPLLPERGASENAAYMMFGISDIGSDPWDKKPRRRLISHKVIDIPDADKVSASPTHITWNTRSLMRLFGDALVSGKVPGIVHTHPGSYAFFSSQDDENERELARTAYLKGLPGLVSVVLGGDGSVCGRMWTAADDFQLAKSIGIVGRRFIRHQGVGSEAIATPHLDRQARLFGNGFNKLVQDLKVCVVGSGGTGSPLILMLARLGVGHIFVIDDDVIDETNLNRVHGSRRIDIGTPKVSMIEREINAMDLGCDIVVAKGWVGDPKYRDVLKSSDFVFGCTDDNSGRILLNRLAYFYGIPVIDVGLRMMAPEGRTRFDLNGRVSTLVAGHTCLVCAGVVNAVRAQEEELERSQPDEFQRRKAEAYVFGGGDPAPAVVTFTTEMASVAINEMIAALTGFQGDEGMVAVRVRRWHVRDERFPAPNAREECPICQSELILGAADVTPFLDIIG